MVATRNAYTSTAGQTVRLFAAVRNKFFERVKKDQEANEAVSLSLVAFLIMF